MEGTSGTKKLGLTETKMIRAIRTGQHATVYEVRRDPDLQNKNVIRDRTKPVFPFVGGSQYKGQWNNDAKEGFGIQVNSDNTKYEGEWLNNRFHGRGTLWVKKGKTYIRQYVGDWVNGQMDGQGIYYYDNNEIYRGDWKNGKKSGNGRYEYKTGDVYIGDFLNDQQQGFGTLNYANGNIYEGLWSQGKKEGPGIYFYASTKKIYHGEWSDDQPKCGEFRAPTTNEELRFVHPLPKGIYYNEFQLPGIGLKDPQQVLDLAISSTRLGNIQKSLSTTEIAIPEVASDLLERAKMKFDQIVIRQSRGTVALTNTEVIPLSALEEILKELDISVQEYELEGIKLQLYEKDIHTLSFADVAEILAFIKSEERVIENNNNNLFTEVLDDFGESKYHK